MAHSQTEGREQLKRCAEDLEVLSAELEEFLPMEERFERSASNTDAEIALRPDLDGVFDGDKPELVFECRGDVCKIDMLWEDGDDEGEWHRTMQTGALTGKVCGQGFHSGISSADQVAGKAVRLNTVYWRLCPPGVPGGQFATRAWHRFLASADKARCVERYPSDRGVLEVRLAVATKNLDARIGAHIGGSLSITEVGKCLTTTLERIVAEEARELPDQVQPMVVHARLTLPE